MFGVLLPRLPAPSRPGPHADVREYARLEHPHEDPRTIEAIALAALPASDDHPRRFFRWFRRRTPAGAATAGNL